MYNIHRHIILYYIILYYIYNYTYIYTYIHIIIYYIYLSLYIPIPAIFHLASQAPPAHCCVAWPVARPAPPAPPPSKLRRWAGGDRSPAARCRATPRDRTAPGLWPQRGTGRRPQMEKRWRYQGPNLGMFIKGSLGGENFRVTDF